MKLRTLAATAIVAGTAFAGSAGILAGGTAHAATVTCKTAVTHHHSVTARGTVSDYTLRKVACGKDYTETETGTTRSYTGSHSAFRWTKAGTTGGCWTKTEWRTSVSSKGTVSSTVTHSGTC